VLAFTASWLFRPTSRLWLWVMTARSLVFYGWTDERFVLLLLGSIVVSWSSGIDEDLRQDDGIHLSRAGADRLARHLLSLVADEIDQARQ